VAASMLKNKYFSYFFCYSLFLFLSIFSGQYKVLSRPERSGVYIALTGSWIELSLLKKEKNDWPSISIFHYNIFSNNLFNQSSISGRLFLPQCIFHFKEEGDVISILRSFPFRDAALPRYRLFPLPISKVFENVNLLI